MLSVAGAHRSRETNGGSAQVTGSAAHEPPPVARRAVAHAVTSGAIGLPATVRLGGGRTGGATVTGGGDAIMGA
jgi:hypothetical protein